LPPNTDWNTLRNDLDSVAQNERNLKLFLQLATHTANRLTHLRKKTNKGYDCNRRNDNPISMTETLITQLPSQTNPEWLDKSQTIQTYSSSDDSETNLDQNQTAFYSQLQELSDLKNIDDNRDTERNLDSKMNNLIPKSIQDTSSDIIRYNHEALGYKLDSDTASNSLNANEFRSDSLQLTRNVNEKINQIDLKNITNTSIMDDLTETVNQFFPNPQNLQESTFEISQRLFGTDLAQIVPKIISDVHRNATQFIPLQNTQNTRKPSDKIDDINQRFFNPIIKNAGNIMNSQTADNLSIVNQILSSTKNIVESMIKILPEAAKGANLLNQVIPQSQDTINMPLKVAEESKKYLAQSDYTHQEQNKNPKHTQAAEQFNNLLHNRQNLINNLENNIRETTNTSGKNNQETRTNLSINENNLTAEDSNKQHIPTLLNDSSIPFLRFLSDFNEQENNNNETETNLSSIQTNEKANSSNDEKLLIRDRKKTDQRLDQIDEEIKAEGFKQMNETRTDYSDGQLNPISDLSQKNKESELTEVVVATLASPNQLEFSTLDSIIEYRTKNSSGIQDSENVSDVIKSDLEEARFQDNLSTNDKISQSTGNQIMHVNDLIDNLKSKDLYKQLSAKLQEISDRLINALRSIIEKKMDNNQNYMTDHYSK